MEKWSFHHRTVWICDKRDCYAAAAVSVNDYTSCELAKKERDKEREGDREKGGLGWERERELASWRAMHHPDRREWGMKQVSISCRGLHSLKTASPPLITRLAVARRSASVAALRQWADLMIMLSAKLRALAYDVSLSSSHCHNWLRHRPSWKTQLA